MNIPEDQVASYQAFVSSHILLCIAKKCSEDPSTYEQIKEIVGKGDLVLNSVPESGILNLGTISIALYSLTAGPHELLKGRAEYKKWENQINELEKSLGADLVVYPNTYPGECKITFARHIRNASAHFKVFSDPEGFLILKDKKNDYKWECRITRNGLGSLIDTLTKSFMKEFGKAKS